MRCRTIALTGSLAFGLAACQQAPTPLSDEDIAAIHQIEQDFAQAALAGDWDTMVAFFAEDAIRMPFNAPMERGRETIRAHFNTVDSITQWTVHESQVDGEGDLAYLRQAYTVTGFLTGMPGGVSYTGKSLAVLHRQPNGQWLFVIDIWNSDAPFGMPE